MTKEEHEEILRKIAESGGATPEMLDEIQKLRDEYDEREGMLRKDGEIKDGSGETESGGKDEVKPSDVSRETDWEAKYNGLWDRYKERFWDGKKDVMEETKEDVKEDGEKMTYEKLFEKREN